MKFEVLAREWFKEYAEKQLRPRTLDRLHQMHPNTPYHWLERFCKRNNFRFLGVHQFRHLNATLLITSGVDARTVSAALGHSQVSTTLNIYSHTFAETQARASEAVAAALQGKVGTA